MAFCRTDFPVVDNGCVCGGMVRVVIQPEWIEALVGQGNLQGNATAVFFAVFMYLPTLVEVQVAKCSWVGLLSAYLMTDPGLSLQSIPAGLLFGSRVDAIAIAIAIGCAPPPNCLFM